MSNRGILITIFFALIATTYFAFFSGEKKKKRIESKNLGFLTSNQNGSESGNRNQPKGYKDNNSSVIDEKSKFWTDGIPEIREEGTIANEVANEDIPDNPQTGKPWEEEAMQQFEELRKNFPENDLIPRRTTKEERAKQAQSLEKFNKSQVSVNSGKFTRDDLDTYFSRQKKIVEDRLQIIEHLVESQKEDGEVDKDGQFQKILEGTKEQIKQLEREREDLLKKAGG